VIERRHHTLESHNPQQHPEVTTTVTAEDAAQLVTV